MPVPLPPWDRIHELLDSGRVDDAVVHAITEYGYLAPSDLELSSLFSGEDSTILLDDNLIWSVCPRPLAERLLQLVQAGRLTISEPGFVPNSPAVLEAKRAKIVGGRTAAGNLPVAIRQPKNGYRTPHRVHATLRRGPAAELPNNKRLVAELREGRGA